jgi:hypothetical protein
MYYYDADRFDDPDSHDDMDEEEAWKAYDEYLSRHNPTDEAAYVEMYDPDVEPPPVTRRNPPIPKVDKELNNKTWVSRNSDYTGR